ncbi:pyrimidine utilization protein D [Sphingomonas ginsenosidivorax]|uniref:Putative carbamate hydrolase RutD n=1 Tax=Sphingomonas ginsenosidivorax TaxID=862135 RepID=A0A5C6UC26_9SPHN|nr:pyrimidine utilization protein D [Sphingomonas ginsenosidivorax]TXC70377.1 pyrimidine utilization protein D [Sphingomonas ginsenosidivorax]
MPTIAGLHWEEHGRADGPAILLSSGLGGAGAYWNPNLAALGKRHRVITYDHRGTGRSERIVPGDLTVEAMAADVVTLLDGLGIDRVTFIGHALGGHVGLALALSAPERLERLVVINGWAKLDPHTARCFDTRLALLRDSGPRAYLHAQPLFLYPPQWISDHHDALQAEEEVHLAHFPGAEMVQRRVAAVRRFNIAGRLDEIRVPTLLVASDDDMLVPPSASERLAAGIHAAQLARMASGGHACNVTRAEHFNMWLLDWLDAGEGE